MSPAERLRRRVSSYPREGGRRFPRELKAELASFAQTESAAGASVAQIARSLGVSAPSVRRWLDSAPGAATLVAVGSVEVPARTLRVTLPGGLVVEGLDVAGVAALSRELTS